MVHRISISTAWPTKGFSVSTCLSTNSSALVSLTTPASARAGQVGVARCPDGDGGRSALARQDISAGKGRASRQCNRVAGLSIIDCRLQVPSCRDRNRRRSGYGRAEAEPRAHT